MLTIIVLSYNVYFGLINHFVQIKYLCMAHPHLDHGPVTLLFTNQGHHSPDMEVVFLASETPSSWMTHDGDFLKAKV